LSEMYVSKDAPEGEVVCRFLALRVTPVTGFRNPPNWLPKHATPGFF
jgi:hypothetical protein